MPLTRTFRWGLLLGGSLLALYLGCSESSSPPSASGGSPQGGASAGSSVGGISSGGSTGGSTGGLTLAGNAGIPQAGTGGSAGAATAGTQGSSGSSPEGFPVIGPDWITYQPKNSPCVYHVMPKGGTPPPPIEWGPCASDGIQGVACQQRVPTTTDAISQLEGDIFWDRWASPPHMLLARISPQGFELDFWRPDGTFAGAIANKGGAGYKPCSLNFVRPPNDGTYFLDHLEATDGSKSFVLVGKVGEVPSYTIATNDTYENDDEDYFGTKNWVITLGDELYASPWNSDDRQVIYSPSTHPSGLPALPEFGHEDAFFLKLSAGGKSGWVAWVAGKGIQDLLIQPVSYQRGFTSLGTDGKDMVVTYGENATGEYEYSQRTVLLAKYTTDPKELASSAKAVATVPKHSPTKRWAVGCGYAAIGAADSKSGVSLLVVRLSDGMTWRKFPLDPKAFGGIVPKALTCQELFLAAGHKGYVQRIALDSLGEGQLAPPQVSDWPF